MRSNYVTSSTTLGTGYAFIFLGIITVAIRFAVRKWKRVSIGPDDWLSLAALVFVISYCITMIYGASHSSFRGNNNDTTPKAQAKGGGGVVALSKATRTLPNPAIRLTKLSVLLFYRRVFQTHNKAFNVALWAIVAIVSARTIAFTFLDIFDCRTPIVQANII